MTNHFDQATSRIAEAVQLRQTLDDTYDLRPHDRLSIATLHESLRFCLSMAKLHSNLAEVQALYDLRSEVAVLFQELTKEPEPFPGFEDTAQGRALASVTPLDGERPL